jgi:uncharacterized protein (DUF342 family)
MPSDDRSLDNLIRSSEDLVRDLESGSARSSRALPEPIDRELEENVAVPVAFLALPSADGQVEISVSRDEMLVHASFHPPNGNGSPLALGDVQKAINTAGITGGIDWEAVKGCVLTCNEERTEILDVVLARGKKPIDEVPPYLVLSDRLVSRQQKEDPAGARVDFKELALFTLVKKGEELAELMPKQDGAMGINVRGNAVAFGKQHVPYPRPGKNTAWDAGRVFAQCDGRFQVTADSFWIDEILDILGDIDLRVGNIDFPGDVVIRGEIRDGFVVKAGKSILCTGCIGAARIDCGGDLVTQQGIVGKEKAVIRVGGAAEAKFIEGCALDAVGPIRVRTSVLNSTIHTKGSLEMGERGIIIGGIVKAQNGVLAAQIGTERGSRTEIHCGIDFKVEQKLVWIRDRNIALAFKLKELDTKMKTNVKVREVLAPLRERIKAAIHQLNENARAMVSGLDRNEEAVVSVRGNVYPGTYIEICHVSHFITRPRRFLTFKLDKPQGKIVEAAWKKPSGSAAAAETAAQSAAAGAVSR